DDIDSIAAQILANHGFLLTRNTHGAPKHLAHREIVLQARPPGAANVKFQIADGSQGFTHCFGWNGARVYPGTTKVFWILLDNGNGTTKFSNLDSGMDAGRPAADN